MITPTQRFYRAAPKAPRTVSTGIDRGADWVSGALKRRGQLRRELRRRAKRADALYTKRIGALGETDFQEKLQELHRRIRRGEANAALSAEALACVMRAAQESLGLRPYLEQLMGAVAIDEGLFAEMATGEGKTLTIGLAGVLAGWRGRPCHIITANNYLAERDAETMRPLYERCGLSVGHVIGEMSQEDRPRQYEADIVYTTSQDILADFLRDKLKLGDLQTPQSRLIQHIQRAGASAGERLVMRGIDTVIIDEADNILIDEAVTPLIISQTMKGHSFDQCCSIARDLAASLEAGHDYTIDFKHNEVTLRNQGKAAITRQSHRLPAIWRSHDRRNELVRQALIASHFFINGKHYVITDEEKVEIVDEFTGRILPGRTWKQGLHQAIESKEGIAVTDPTETLASMSFQRFFRLFHSISGISGTAKESSSELWRMFRLPVVCIPTHRPVQRLIEETAVYPSREEKYAAILADVRAMRETGRPVLIGTRTVESSDALSELFTAAELPHLLLNAVRHKEESEIISHAGERGSICIATNMAGRGTDIKLDPKTLELGGLHVIVVERNLSPRIDRQLVGRAARQGEPGSAKNYFCPEDELTARFLKPFARKRLAAAVKLRAPGHIGQAEKACRAAQKTAERIGMKQRESVLKMDMWLDEQLVFTRQEAR